MSPRPRAVFFALLTLLLADCAQNPVTGEVNFVLVTEQQELSLGRRADQDVKKEYALYDIRGLQDYVNSVGQRLSGYSHRSALNYRFTVLDSPEVNAFALPGGYIYVTRGILAFLNSEAELAAVLGHEIGHVTARHSVRQISAAQGADILFNILGAVSPAMRSSGVQSVTSLLGNVLLAGYGREHELEADRLGAEYLARAGYDPQAMIRVIGVLKNQELFDAETAKQEGREARAYHGVFASHPDNDTRLKEVVGAAERLRTGQTEEGRDTYLARTTGMVFGDSAHEGFVRGGSFYHTDMGIALRLPVGWRVLNQRDRVTAIAPGAEARLEMTLEKKPQGEPADFLRRATRGTANDIEVGPINALPAAVAIARGRLIAVIFHGGNAFILAGAGRAENAFSKHLETMRTSIGSFHAMTAEERAAIRPLAINVKKAAAATRFADLAQGSPLGKNAEAMLRLVNALYPTGEPKPGQPVKVID